MQKYKVADDSVSWTAEDGSWVPADVAQGLYDAANMALAAMPIAGESERQDEARWALMEALSAADGEEE